MTHRDSGIAARRWALRSALGAIALAAGSVAFHVAAHASATPAVQITPNHGPYGTVTVVTGQNFAAHEQVAIYKETRAFFAYETDASGSFVGQPHPLMGPGPLSGIITITAIGRTSGLKATTTYTVTQ
jgi:hypothetical protein